MSSPSPSEITREVMELDTDSSYALVMEASMTASVMV